MNEAEKAYEQMKLNDLKPENLYPKYANDTIEKTLELLKQIDMADLRYADQTNVKELLITCKHIQHKYTELTKNQKKTKCIFTNKEKTECTAPMKIYIMCATCRFN